MNIGKRLKNLRTSRDYTLEYVGKIIGVSKQTLYKYENSIITNIPSDKIEALAVIYNTTPQFIMGWNEEPETKTEEWVVDAYNRLRESNDPKDRAALSAIHRLLGMPEHGNDE